MSKVRFELDRAGVRALMRSPEMQAVLKARADTVKGRCGDGYEAYMAQTRAVAVVETATPQAADDNSAHNTLLKATSTAHGIEGVHHHKRQKDCRAIRYRRKR